MAEPGYDRNENEQERAELAARTPVIASEERLFNGANPDKLLPNGKIKWTWYSPLRMSVDRGSLSTPDGTFERLKRLVGVEMIVSAIVTERCRQRSLVVASDPKLP